MARPDFERMRRESQTIIGGAGEVATLKKWIGDTTGTPQFGVQNQSNYTDVLVTALFKSMGPVIIPSQGGWIQVNALSVTLPFEITPRDQIIYAGSAYRVDGNPDRETFGAGRVLFHHPLRLASITG
jgi:hypothetical protein